MSLGFTCCRTSMKCRSANQFRIPNVEALRSLRTLRALVRWALALYVLCVGAAIAAPLFHSDTLTLLCSASGGVKLVQVDGDDVNAPSTETHLLDCVMCLPGGAPPPQASNIVALTDFDSERYFSPVARLRSQTPVTASARDPPFTT